MTEDRKPAKPGMSEVSPRFAAEAEAATAAPPSSASVTDNLLVTLAADYYAAYIAREEVEHLAEKSDSQAIRIETGSSTTSTTRSTRRCLSRSLRTLSAWPEKRSPSPSS